MTNKADADYAAALKDQKINDQQAIENFMDSTSGITDYGENLQGILLNAIASGLEGLENVDLSALFSEIDPSEYESLMAADPMKFLSMLGLSEEILFPCSGCFALSDGVSRRLCVFLHKNLRKLRYITLYPVEKIW